MLSPMSVCTWCGDEYDLLEGEPVTQDPDEPQFCSDEHREAQELSDQYEQEYRQGASAL